MMDDDWNDEATQARRRFMARANWLRFILIFIMFTSLIEDEDGLNRRKSLRAMRLASRENGTNVTQMMPEEVHDELYALRLYSEKERTNRSEEWVMNMSCTLKGTWRLVDGEDTHGVRLLGNTTNVEFDGFRVGLFSTVELNPSIAPEISEFPLTEKSGVAKLKLTDSKTKIKSIAQIDAKMQLINGETSHSEEDILTILSGIYLRNYGQLSLTASVGFKGRHNAIQFPKSNIQYTSYNTELGSRDGLQDLVVANGSAVDDVVVSNESWVEGVKFIDDRNYVIWDYNDKLYYKKGLNFRHHQQHAKTQNNACFFRLDLQQTNDPPQHHPTLAESEESHQNRRKYIGGKNSSDRHRARVVHFAGLGRSENCNVSLWFEFSMLEVHAAVHKKSWKLSALLGLATVAQIGFYVAQFQHSDTQTNAAKASTVMVMFLGYLDSLTLLLYLFTSSIHPVFYSTFSIVAVLCLLLFLVCDMRFIHILWKAQRPAAFNQGWTIMRRELERLYSTYYLTLIIVLFATYNTTPALIKLTLTLLYSYWVPQIVTNIIRDTGDPLNEQFMIGTAVSRLFFPMYVFGCPESLVLLVSEQGWEWSPVFCAWLVLWQTVQVVALMLQKRKGARYLVPKSMLPAKYNYNRAIPIELRDTECVICMLPVTAENTTHMITPCNHIFHQHCLQHWLDIKEECPSCRARLPPS